MPNQYVAVECLTRGCTWVDQLQPPKGGTPLRVIRCPKHGTKHLKLSGAVHGLISEDPDAFRIPASDSTADALVHTDLWTHFCNVLDSSRSIMAGGNPVDTSCRTCEEHNNHQRPGCVCVCHMAWTYRHALERATREAKRAA